MGIVELLQKRGVYCGQLRHMVENGTVFQMDHTGQRVPVRVTPRDDIEPATKAPATSEKGVA